MTRLLAQHRKSTPSSRHILIGLTDQRLDSLDQLPKYQKSEFQRWREETRRLLRNLDRPHLYFLRVLRTFSLHFFAEEIQFFIARSVPKTKLPRLPQWIHFIP